ncbi:MAG: hypothetical protein ACFFCH_05545 [Promethearchaeota archaeon]
MSRNQTQKLANLRPYQRGITITFQVIKTEAVRKVQSRNDGSKHQVADMLIGDETGVMLLTLWDDEITQVEPGKVFRIDGGQSGLFQGRLQVSLGRSGKLGPSDQSIAEVNTERNLSSQSRSLAKESKSKKRSGTRSNPPTRRGRGFKWSRIDRESN